MKLANCRNPTEAWDVQIVGSVASVAADDRGLFLIDVSDPRHPALLGSSDTLFKAAGLTVVGTNAFVAVQEFETGGLEVFDVSVHTRPVSMAQFYMEGDSDEVRVVDSIAYVADGAAGLSVLDVSDPKHPVRIGQCPALNQVEADFVSGQYAYLAEGESGLSITRRFAHLRCV